MKDAEWIAHLLEHGLLRLSFVPPPPIRRLRNLTRYPVSLLGDRTRDAIRLEQLLEDASIKLSVVASSVTTVSARAMLAELVAGNRDTAAMADLAHSKMRCKIPALMEALTGHFDEHHALLVGAMLHRLDHVQAAAELDARIVSATAPWAHQLELLQTIPGGGLKTAQVFIAETGGGHVPVPDRGARGLGQGCAGDARVRRQAQPGRVARAHAGRGRLIRVADQEDLPRCAVRADRGSAWSQASGGRGRALHPGVRLLHAAARRALPEVGVDWFDQRHADAHTGRLVAQLKRLGHTVILDSATSPS